MQLVFAKCVLCQHILGKITWKSTQKGFFYCSVSTANRLVVDRPNHGPGIDVEQGAAKSGLTSTYWQGWG